MSLPPRTTLMRVNRLLVLLLLATTGLASASTPLGGAEAAGLLSRLVDRVQPGLPGGRPGELPHWFGRPSNGEVDAWWNASLARVGGWFAVSPEVGSGALTTERARGEIQGLIDQIGRGGKAAPLVLLGHSSNPGSLVFVGLAYLGPPEPRLVALRVDPELRTAFEDRGPLGVLAELAGRTGLPLRDYLAARETDSRIALALLDGLRGLVVHPPGLPAVVEPADLSAYLTFEHPDTLGLETVSFRFAARANAALFARLPLVIRSLQSNLTLARLVAIARAVEESRDRPPARDHVPAP